MNHPYRHAPPIRRVRPCRLTAYRLASLALLACACWASPASAQRAGLKPDIKTAPDAKARTPEITQFIDTQVKTLADDAKPDAQQRARNLLVQESGSVGGTPSASYLNIYATVLNDKLMPLTKSPSPRVRLNAAVALQKVAKNANNGALAPAAAAFAQDPCFGVALWAAKASQSIITPLAASGARTELPRAIVDAVKKHPKSGEMVEEAYRGLTLGGGFRNVNPRSVGVVTAEVLRLLEYRNGLFTTQTAPRPELESYAINHLTLARVWEAPEGKKLSPAIMQQLSNLVGIYAQHAAARENPPDREPFVGIMKSVGGGLVLISKQPDMKGAGLEKAGKALQALQANMAEDEFTTRASAVFDAIKAKFPQTKPFATISENAASQVEEEIPEEDPANAKPTTREAGADIAADGDDKAAAGKTSGDGAAGTGDAAKEKAAKQPPATPKGSPALPKAPPAGKPAAPAPPPPAPR